MRNWSWFLACCLAVAGCGGDDSGNQNGSGGSAGSAGSGGMSGADGGGCTGVAPRMLQTPCAMGERRVGSAYSECQTDCLWHVVQDDYYGCPPNGDVATYRVYDEKTTQACGAGQAPPNLVGTRYPVQDTGCLSPVPANPPAIVITSCDGVNWRHDKFDVVMCLDGRTLMSPNPTTGVSSTVSCDMSPPAPPASLF